MRHSEMVELIRDGCDVGGTWAELGAGTGNFTWALRELIGPQGTIVAIDRDPRAIQQLQQRIARAGKGATIQPIQADFTRPLNLPLLDGILMANALHFIRKQVATVKKLASYLRVGGHFLVVEYDVCFTRPWIPFPLGKNVS